ncbi:transcription regulator [Lactobacillus plantarum JDM1] [Lactiplantibacillus mudanjiangensis]|uniref:MarR family winged helix-turn-helix transcriptional regulator n=1 Tax=Lactiplantibacillus mudanjiangensis TaxID=1296538 RepID=UPI001014B973|nr:MarR family winged helix-turn-helix transcriptional regulator [Lactiplantibacillus mudanjiangensis]VDG21092.1 transcription regulator [Lactobacillus plantarum JDM1] [Lactiplantibacillus mudanjiangensis]VDG31687.1 transcription regulator [Lactobacillus plantarum JDM1] [Lactiplantibacillus mudanjiangensis]
MIPTLRLMGTISRMIMNEGNQRFAQYGLNNNQFIYLIRICEQPGLFFGQLADQMKMDRTTNYRAVQNLIKKGYVVKTTQPDNKKVRCLYPTEAGQALYPQLHEYEQWCAELVAENLTPGQRQVLFEDLSLVAEQVQHAIEAPVK